MTGIMREGYYPATPVQPTFALHENIFRFFYSMQMRGATSKETYCHALYEMVYNKSESALRSELPKPDTFYKRFLTTYSIWQDIQAILKTKTENLLSLTIAHNITETHTASDLIQQSWSLMGESTEVLQKPLPLRQLCSGCFGDDPTPELAMICFDGNFQQKRLQGRGRNNFVREFRDRRLFIDENLNSEQYQQVFLLINLLISRMHKTGNLLRLVQETSELQQRLVNQLNTLILV
jgi:hypothetical protein